MVGDFFHTPEPATCASFLFLFTKCCTFLKFFPNYVDIQSWLRYCQMVWNSFKGSKTCDSTLVKSSHQDVIVQPQFFNKSSWLHNLSHCIRRFSCTFNNSATKLQSMMELNYKQAWLNTIHNGSKLRSYAIFKRDFFLEKYLLQESLVNRKNLTRLRISSHKLWVETGRFKKTPLDNRSCAMCDKGLVEDEFHFIISCTAYEKPRDHLFKYLSSFSWHPKFVR